MATLTVPLSRIEGHARVLIDYRRGQVLSARLQATELRGFEYYVQGAPAEQLPVIVPRICGVCSTAHHLAAVKALEFAYEVIPPPKAIEIRELMMLGQLIQNQATSVFLFTMPDFAGKDQITSLFGLRYRGQDIAAKALFIRRIGTRLITVAGGQFIHPIKAVVGGVTSGIQPKDRDTMRQEIVQALPVAKELVDLYWEMFLQLGERIGTLGDDEPTYYVAAVEEGHAYYGNLIHVLSPQGIREASFAACDYATYFVQVPIDSSYSNGTLFRGHILRANSLARLNLLPRLGTPLADEQMLRFHQKWGHPAHAILLFDLARAIELLYCLEQAAVRLTKDLHTGELRVGYTRRDGTACGLVEAPRGPLIHHYEIQNNLVKRARFIIPTQHNILAIERALKVAAKRYITEQGVDHELLNAIGRVVRAFDPCIACATH